ncbi:hypothetical protein N7520_011452 [Penicillium odoratum]|uniref:uncharacterized protein n=1 Tax=Penicillium odoratum TaxID=1167516 RepID=UPI002546A1E2|nr:uncharacterized protein N7520_011452 [Penicillium odoratum]KAJ5746270.1 hypothetical protein N7520_011452 [Penicillium odoratum]
MSPPTLIFVHGAWHSPKCWEKVIPKLEQKGYRCHAPHLEMCATGTEKPADSLRGSVNQIQDIISSEISTGNDVLIVAHSMGGRPGCAAVEGFTQKNPSRLSLNSGKVIGILQISGFFPIEISELVKIDFGTPFFSRGGVWITVDLADPVDLFYGDLSLQEARLWESRILKLSAACNDDWTLYSGWKDVPVWYLVCTQDKAILPQAQEDMIAIVRGAGANVTTRQLDSSHSPFLSLVDETVDFILEAVVSLIVL